MGLRKEFTKLRRGDVVTVIMTSGTAITGKFHQIDADVLYLVETSIDIPEHLDHEAKTIALDIGHVIATWKR